MKAEELKKVIKELKLTQKEFADTVGVHTNTVSQWVREINDIPEWIPNFIEYYKKSKAFDEIAKRVEEIKNT